MNDPEDHTSLKHADRSVRELLTDMKDTSEVITDLAYASLMYDSQDMADKVRELEEEMDDLKFAIRYKVLLASRTREDARQLSGLLEVASAADRISNAASDTVNLLRFPKEKRPLITEVLTEADEKIRSMRIRDGSSMIGKTIGELMVEACTGCKIIALKGRHGWVYDPEDDTKIRVNDDIIVRGTDDGADLLKEFADGVREWEYPEVPEDEEEAEEEAEEVEQSEMELTEEIRGDDE
ncbi:MAG: potassium transporter TrkA [archaeon]|nr:potassium transporter TrkA [archaeon]